MQHLLGRASWDTDGVFGDLRNYVTGQIGDTDVVLVVDETEELRKGTATVWVQRQYTGTAGRIENAQVAVYLTYAAARGHTMIDPELYLPKSWIDDLQRCAAAGVPEDIGFLTSPRCPPECCCARSTPQCRRGGWPVTRSTARTRRCALNLRPVGSASWLSAATAASRPLPATAPSQLAAGVPRGA